MNLGKTDRKVRAGIGAMILLIAFFGGIEALVAQNILGIIGSVTLLTALIGFDPFYFLFRFSTREKSQKTGKKKRRKTDYTPQLYTDSRKRF